MHAPPEKEVVPKYTCEKTVYDSEKGVNVSNLEFYDFDLYQSF